MKTLNFVAISLLLLTIESHAADWNPTCSASQIVAGNVLPVGELDLSRFREVSESSIRERSGPVEAIKAFEMVNGDRVVIKLSAFVEAKTDSGNPSRVHLTAQLLRDDAGKFKLLGLSEVQLAAGNEMSLLAPLDTQTLISVRCKY